LNPKIGVFLSSTQYIFSAEQRLAEPRQTPSSLLGVTLITDHPKDGGDVIGCGAAQAAAL
jgi:hypothetical protein